MKPISKYTSIYYIPLPKLHVILPNKSDGGGSGMGSIIWRWEVQQWCPMAAVGACVFGRFLWILVIWRGFMDMSGIWAGGSHPFSCRAGTFRPPSSWPSHSHIYLKNWINSKKTKFLIAFPAAQSKSQLIIAASRSSSLSMLGLLGHLEWVTLQDVWTIWFWGSIMNNWW